MKFTTRVEGASDAGSLVGLPTVALFVPDSIPTSLPQGSYAARAHIGYDDYAGIVAYEPDPLAGGDPAMLFFPFDTSAFFAGEGTAVAVEIVRSIRAPAHFEIPEQLVRQFQSDMSRARTILHS